MNISHISFGARKKDNYEYNYIEYYNLNNSDNLNCKNIQKNNFTPQIQNNADNDEFFQQYPQPNNNQNKSHKKTGTVIASVCGFILTSILGISVAANTQQSPNESYIENTSKNNYSTTATTKPTTTPQTETNNENNYFVLQTIQDTKDYIIGNTKQGKTADCWLLAVINSLNETEEGKEFFKNMFEYKDNETIVHLFVGDYTITDKELEKGKIRNSKGDDDVLLIELAVEKALADYNDGKVILPQAVITDELGGKGTSSTLNMGSQDAAIYILTGKSAEYLKMNKYENKIDNYFNLFKTNNKKNMSLTASIEKDSTTYTNKNNERIFLRGHHAYCIKEIRDNSVIITNPDDSKIEIEIDIDSFKDIFQSVTVADISDIA